MNKKDCTVGLRVGLKTTQYFEGDDPRPGTVVAGDAEPGYVQVEWDLYEYQVKAGEKPVARPERIKDLLPFKEALAQFKTLEKEFTAYEKQIEKKMKEAAKLIREADKLARKAGVDSLNEMHNATYPLYDAMDDTGWNTSSFNC